jgi:hypothetical protein
MIVQMHTGAVLELFWRHRGVRSWSPATALAFLLRYRRDRQAIRQLRQCLAQRFTSFEIWRLRDEDLFKRAAMLITGGRLIVAQYRFTERMSGTGIILGSSWDPVLLIWRDDLHPGVDVAYAVWWLRRVQAIIRELQKTKEEKEQDPRKLKNLEDELRGHTRELDRLRAMSAIGPLVPSLAHVNDELFAEETIKLLESGALIPIYHRNPGALDVRSEPEAAPAPPAQRPIAEREEAESNTFDPDHNGALQAQALSDAAEEGLPFCEECARAAAQ